MLLESPFMRDVLQKQVEQAVRPFIEPIQRNGTAIGATVIH
jgi:hypothetical protein